MTKIPRRNLKRLIENAEEAQKRLENTRSVEGVGVRIDTEAKGWGGPLYEELAGYLRADARDSLVRELRYGPRALSRKVTSIWQKFLPAPLTNGEKDAAERILRDPALTWRTFLADPDIERALVDNVIYDLLDELSTTATFAEGAMGDPGYPHRRKEFLAARKAVGEDEVEEAEIEAAIGKESPLQKWERECPEVYMEALSQVDSWIEGKYRKEPIQLSDAAIEAIRATRMMSYCLCHAHFAGRVELQGPRSDLTHVMLKSPEFDMLKAKMKQSHQSREGLLMLSLARMSIGPVEQLEFNVDTEKTQLIARLLEEPGRNGGDALYERIVDEANPYSIKYQKGGKYTPGHIIDQISSALAPVLMMDPAKMRQKQMDPRTCFGLYKLGVRLRPIAERTVFPLTGVMDVPKTIPQGFRLRLPAQKMEANGWTPEYLQASGIQPYVHEEFPKIAEQVLGYFPDMQERIADSGALRELKQAHTRQVVLSPVLERVKQEEVRQAYKKIDPDGYYRSVAKAYEQVDPKRYGGITGQDIKERRPIARVEDAKTYELILIEVFKKGLWEFENRENGIDLLADALREGEKIICYQPQMTATHRASFPFQPHPFVEDNGVGLAEEGVIRFQRREITRAEANNEKGVMLSDTHYKQLSINGRGVLPDHALVMQMISTTFNPDTVNQVFSHYNEKAGRKLRKVTDGFTAEAGGEGVLCFPYIHTGSQGGPCRDNQAYQREVANKGIPICRIRNRATAANLPKYATPALRTCRAVGDKRPVREAPLYLPVHYVSEKAVDFLEAALLEMILKRAQKGRESEEIGREALARAGFPKYRQGILSDETAPLFCIEGEKKAQCVEFMQQLALVERCSAVLSAENPEKELARIEKVNLAAVVGSVGVWITQKNKSGRQHVIRPEVPEAVNLRQREVVLMYDGDGLEPGSETRNQSIAKAAASASTVLVRDFGCKTYLWRPPAGPGKGVDDWVQERAARAQGRFAGAWGDRVYAAYADLRSRFHEQMRPLKKEIVSQELSAAQKKGVELDDVLCSSPPVTIDR